ncbi:MAG: DNA polymerase IV [Acidobacteriia bacterium]|nr:DNA polymerase IV [Terriglobia bacterium]
MSHHLTFSMLSSRIFHVDMDAFFVSVEELLDPSLQGKPVVVGAQPGHRGVVAAASYEARKFGVHSAMPVSEAVRLCPHAIFLPGHSSLYSKYSKQVYEVLCRYSPVVEMVSIDEGYLDMTRTERMFFTSTRDMKSREYAPDPEAGEWESSAEFEAERPQREGQRARPLSMKLDPRNLLGISIASPTAPSAGHSRYAYSDDAGLIAEPEKGTPPQVKESIAAPLKKSALPEVRGSAESEFFMMSVAARLREEIRLTTGLSASIGIGTSRLVAKVASDMAKPRGILFVAPGHEAAFLAPLNIRRIPGIGPKTEERLNQLGVHTVGQLQKLDEDFLKEQFGAWGESLAIKSRGGSDWRYSGEEDPKSISHENTFSRDTTDREEIESTLVYLIQRVGKRLRDHGLYASTIQLKLRDQKFRTITRAVTLSEPTEVDAIILRNALVLLRENWNGKTPIRLVGVAVSHLGEEAPPAHLIDVEKTDRLEKLYRAADTIREKYGFDSLKAARGGGRKKREREK